MAIQFLLGASCLAPPGATRLFENSFIFHILVLILPLPSSLASFSTSSSSLLLSSLSLVSSLPSAASLSSIVILTISIIILIALRLVPLDPAFLKCVLYSRKRFSAAERDNGFSEWKSPEHAGKDFPHESSLLTRQRIYIVRVAKTLSCACGFPNAKAFAARQVSMELVLSGQSSHASCFCMLWLAYAANRLANAHPAVSSVRQPLE